MSAAPKFKKAPDAPKRFKSAFIIFSAEKHKEIKEELARQGRAEKKTTDIAKLVSEAWREMGPEEKEIWEKKARKDKARYEVEKAMYKGPWKIPANKRTPKDPTAPKRPMSAFLAFSNKRRAALKRENPDATNADLSKMLSKTWKDAPPSLRQKYMDEEADLRTIYKVEMAKWRKKVAEEKKQEREEREAMAMQAAEARQDGSAPAVPPGPPQDIQKRNGGNESNINANMNNGPPMNQQMNNPQAAQGNPAAQGQQGQDPSAGGVNPNQMYGNPYGGMTGAFGGFSGMQQGADYSNLMGNNPFGGQGFMGGASNAQQQLLSQLFGQQMKNPMNQGNHLGMYQNMNQGPPMNPGGYGGNAYGMGQGMDNMAAQRAMLEAQNMNNPGGFGGFPGMSGFSGSMSGQMGGMGGMGGGSESGGHDKKEQDNYQGHGGM